MSLELFCINPFIPSAPFFYLLKTLRFSDVFRGRERVHWEQIGSKKKRVTINRHNFQDINYLSNILFLLSNFEASWANISARVKKPLD